MILKVPQSPMPSQFLRLWLLLLLFSLLLSNEAAEPQRKLKVLVYSPLNAWSHMQFVGKVADTLAEAGHEVHLLKFVHDPIIGLKNETKLAQKVFIARPRFTQLNDLNLNTVDHIQNPFTGNGFPSIVALHDNFDDFSHIFVNTCKEMVTNSILLEQLAAEQYDVAIAEHYDFCAFAIFHRIGVRTPLGALAVPIFQMIATHFGIPTFASYVPCMVSPPTNAPQMPFFQRVRNFYNAFYEWIRTDRITHLEQPIIWEAFGRDFPTIGQLARNIALVFVNSSPFLEFPRPTSNKIVHIGGLVDYKAEKLEQRAATILDGSKGGAVLVSFGSITDTTKMSAQMRRAFLRAFSRFPEFEFIWKLDTVSIHNDTVQFASTGNVHTFDWVQQTAILRHPKLRAFISHCGQNSLSEAARAGVPMVAIPLFGDQLYNAVMAKHKGMAIYLDVAKLHDEQRAEELIVDALRKVLHAGTYRSNAKLIEKKLARTPFSVKEKLIRWVEFAAEFGHLNELNLPSDHELHWVVFYSVDVMLFSVVIFAMALLLGFLIVKSTLAFAKKIIVDFIVENKLKTQ